MRHTPRLSTPQAAPLAPFLIVPLFMLPARAGAQFSS